MNVFLLEKVMSKLSIARLNIFLLEKVMCKLSVPRLVSTYVLCWATYPHMFMSLTWHGVDDMSPRYSHWEGERPTSRRWTSLTTRKDQLDGDISSTW